MIDIVRSNYLPGKFVHQVIFFVRAFRRRQDANRTGAMNVPGLKQFSGCDF
jgi:hypothetical protein